MPELVWTAAKQLEVAESVLSGEAHIAFVNQVLLNGGFRLYAAGRVNSIEEGIYTCQGLLESGERIASISSGVSPWVVNCRIAERCPSIRHRPDNVMLVFNLVIV